MDKYEYKLKLDQLKNLVNEGDYETAGQIVDSINWRKVRNSATLCMVGDVYDHLGRYRESKDLYLMAYDHAPIGRNIIYKLTEVAIKSGSVEEAEEYYNEFVEIAGNDTQKYMLRYKLSTLKGEPVQNRISILEELKEREYSEEWAYELACLYQQAGRVRECVETCDELDLWFGEGEYVEKALELKLHFEPLSKSQEDKYRQILQKREQAMKAVPVAEPAKEPVAPEVVKAAEATAVATEAVAEKPSFANDPRRFDTMNLQEELQKSMAQIFNATGKDEVDETMDSIMKMVEDIPQLKKESLEPAVDKLNEEILLEKIDASVSSDFQEFLGEVKDTPKAEEVVEVQEAEPVVTPEEAAVNEEVTVAEEMEDTAVDEVLASADAEGALDKQITGQLNIEDVLAEWEKTKRAAEAAMAVAEQKKLEVAKRKAIQDAQDLINKLQALSPELADGATPKELMEQEIMAGQTEEEPAALEEAVVLEETVAEEPQISLDTDIDGQLVMPDVTAFLQEEFKEAVPETTEDAVVETVATEDEVASEDAGEAEYQAVLDDAHKTLLEEIERIAKATAGIDEILNGPVKEEPVVEVPVATDADVDGQLITPDITGFTQAETPADDLTKEKPTVVTDPEALFAEEAPAATEEVPLPADLEAEVLRLGAGVEEVVLTKEQRALFPYFLPVPGMEAQICQVLKECLNRKKTITSLTGNILIQGPDGSGKTVLAASLIKALQMMTPDAEGRTGKISANALNKKDFNALIPKLQGGYLIIEKAGNLQPQTVERISRAMEGNTQGLVVIMEDSKSRMRALLEQNRIFASKFTSTITIPVFTIDELVDFGKSYAREMECTIDEMGILALYNRISNIQKHDKATTLTEVREIVDHAIESAENGGGGIKKTFGSIFTKRYNENDFLILREKDFNA